MPLSTLWCFAESRRLLWASALLLMSEREVDVDKGLGGKLDTRVLPFGGSGKAPMLEVLRTVLAGTGTPEEVVVLEEGEAEWATDVSAVLRVGTAGVDRALADVGVGSPEVVTDRVSALELGVGMEEVEADRESGVSGVSGIGFLDFTTGRAGRGPDGGASGDAEGRRVPVMVVVADTDIACCRYPSAGQCSQHATLLWSYTASGSRIAAVSPFHRLLMPDPKGIGCRRTSDVEAGVWSCTLRCYREQQGVRSGRCVSIAFGIATGRRGRLCRLQGWPQAPLQSSTVQIE